jgi:putative sterol carrier protein
MPDATTKFFDDLQTRGHEPLLEKATGTVRFDLRNGKRTTRWLVTIDKGNVAVSHRNAKADCVVRADKQLFDGIADGTQNSFAALLRGDLRIEGDAEVLVLFQRLFPGPSRRAS